MGSPAVVEGTQTMKILLAGAFLAVALAAPEAAPEAEAAPKAEADPWYGYYGGWGYRGYYRPYGYYGYYGKRSAEAEPTADAAPEASADPWYGLRPWIQTLWLWILRIQALWLLLGKEVKSVTSARLLPTDAQYSSFFANP